LVSQVVVIATHGDRFAAPGRTAVLIFETAFRDVDRL
jgi:hypothetical protein